MSSLPPPPPWAGPPIGPSGYPAPGPMPSPWYGPPPPPGPPRSPGLTDRSNALRLLVVVIAVVVTGLVSTFVVGDGDDGHPDEWDARVVDLAAFVEEERGHDFDHPVAIDFLSAEAYSARTRTEAAELDEEALADVEQSEAQLRALGLVSGDVDLIESGNDLTDTGTLAFYDPTSERITVRGTEVDAALAVTLVHELTHVLQDQIFGLDALDDPGITSGASFAYRALVEGDAVRIEDRYIQSELSEAEVAEVQGANDEGLEAVDEQAIPDSLQAFFGLPYALGEGFLAVLAADGGDEAIDEAFRDPPSTEEHLADPTSFLAADGAEAVRVPRPGRDAEVLAEGDFGAASLFLVLAQRIPSTQALDAVLGWGGDAYVDFLRDDRACVLLDVVGDDDDDTAELRAALDAWASVAPVGSAVVSQQDEGVRLEACDPGVDAVVTTGSAIDALTVLATHSLVLAEALGQGAPTSFASCYARAVATTFTAAELTGVATPADFDARLTAAADSCR